jgi:hypothetical protein
VKQAYVSVVMRWAPDVTAATMRRIDQDLARSARAHELVLVASPADVATVRASGLLDPGLASSPISLVVTWYDTAHDDALIAGLARAAGDFVIEWNAHAADLTGEIITAALGATDGGFEVVEVIPRKVATLSRIFFAVANAFRPRSSPLLPSVGRLFSRRALDNALAVTGGTPNRTLMVADMGLPRHTIVRDLRYRGDHSYRDRRGEAIVVLTRGTNAARVVPAVVSIFLVLFSLGSAAFAVILFFTRNRSPEGWTTLMVVMGLGLATIIGFLALLWERVDNLGPGQTGWHRTVSNVLVVPPFSVSDPSHVPGPDDPRSEETPGVTFA